jgi:uncharacterized LabA/DUF88 family protein
MSSKTKVFIFWDLQNVSLQSLQSLEKLTETILQKANSLGKLSGQYVYGDVASTEKRRIQKKTMLKKHGFTYVEIASLNKNAADQRLSFDVLKAIGTHDNGHLLLVSGDNDYVPLVRMLKKADMKTTAIAKQKSTSTKLLKLVDQAYFIRDLLDGKEAA